MSLGSAELQTELITAAFRSSLSKLETDVKASFDRMAASSTNVISKDAFTPATADARQLETALKPLVTTLRGVSVEVYKSAHHGSPNGDSMESVTAFNPETVVISVELDNSYGHPSTEALALYEGVGAQVYRTDLNGTVVVTASADGDFLVNANPNALEVATPVPDKIKEETAVPSSSLAYDPDGPDRDCGDFATQAEAQAFYEAAGGPESNPHGLDGEGDGIASLP